LVTLKGVGARIALAAPAFGGTFVVAPIAELSGPAAALLGMGSAKAPAGLVLFRAIGTKLARFEPPTEDVGLPELAGVFDTWIGVRTLGVGLVGFVAPGGAGPLVPLLEGLVLPAAFEARAVAPCPAGDEEGIMGPAAARIAAVVVEMALEVPAS
jgi:hypothetical protein